MPDEPKYTKEIRDGVEVLVYPSGMVKRADNGHYISPPSSAKIADSERGRELYELKRQKGVMAQLRALARGAGIELPEDADLEKIIEGASSGTEALTLHLYKQFMKSENLRGMAEAYGKLSAPMVGDQAAPPKAGNTINVVNISDDVMHFLKDVRALMQENRKIIDADAGEQAAQQQAAHGPADKDAP